MLLILFVLVIFVIIAILYLKREPFIELQPVSDDTILSPSFGTVERIERYDGIIHIIIILNLQDIHSQYIPINGKLQSIIRDENQNYEIVFDLEKSKYNEKVITTIDSKIGSVIVKQIAGILFRRISNESFEPGQDVIAGQKLGDIFFGSRVDLIIPDSVKLNISEKQKVYGPETVIGYLD